MLLFYGINTNDMIDNKRIIVSMTSYPKRITNVGKAIYFLLIKQTVKPDEIHLWLSIEEFPNKEKPSKRFTTAIRR